MSLVSWEAPWHISHWEGLGYIPALGHSRKRYGLMTLPLLSTAPSFHSRLLRLRCGATSSRGRFMVRIPPHLLTFKIYGTIQQVLFLQTTTSPQTRRQVKAQHQPLIYQVKWRSYNRNARVNNCSIPLRWELYSLYKSKLTKEIFLPEIV